MTQHLSKILAGLGVVLLATASLLAQAASPEPKYLYLNCNDDSSREVEAVIEYVNERFGALNRTSPLKVGVSVIYTPDTFYSPNLSSTPFREWGRDEDALRQRLIRHLEFARSREVPLLIQVDIERYVSPDLVNWHDPALPGYHAESNLKNVEWFGWPASSPANASGYAPRLTWRNWGKIIPVPPSPNLMSPVFRARAKALLEPLIEEVRKWEAALPAAQKYLFGGWRVGWETSLNNSELYHTGTNEAYASILAQPDSATNSAIIALLARPIQTLGYNGLRTAGLYKESDGSLTDTSGNLRPLAEEKMNQLLGMYLTEFSKLAVDRGLPRSKIYVHALRGLPALVINPYANPGITGTGRVGFALEGSDNTVTPGEPSVRTNDRAFSGAISQAMGTAQATGYSLGEIPFPNDISTPYTLLRSGQPVTYTYTEPAYERWKRFLDGNFRSIDSLRFASIYNFESVMNQLGAERAIMEFSARPPASPLLNSDFARPEGWRNGAGLNNWETVSSTPPVWRQVNPLSLNSVIRLGPERTLDPGFSQASTRTVASVQFTNIQQTFVDGFKTGDRFRLTFDWRQKAAGLTANARIFAVVAGRIDTANPIWSFSDTASVAPAAPAWRSLTEADPVGWSRPVPADTEALHIQLSNSSSDLPVFFSRVRLVRATADDLNQAPAFTGLVNRVLAPAAANTVTLHPIALNDDRTPLASLVLTARSNNERVVQATISYDATRRQAVLRLTRLAGATGLAGITVTATDADQKTATGWFLVEVTPNQPPLIGVIADQQTEPASTLTVPVNVSDPDLTDNAGLVVTAKVYRKSATLDPDWGNGDGRLLISGTGSTRTLTLRPPARSDGQIYECYVTLTVSDAATQPLRPYLTHRTFVLRVGPSNTAAPTIQWSPTGTGRIPWLRPANTLSLGIQVADSQTTIGEGLRLGLRSTPSLLELAPFPANGTTLPAFSPATPPALVAATPDQRTGTATVSLSAGSQSGLFRVRLDGIDRRIGGLSSRESLLLRVAPDFPPRFTATPTEASTPMGSAWVGSVTLADDDTASSALELVGLSDNPELIAGIEDLTRTGLQRQIKIRPVPGKTGSALITLIVRHSVNILPFGDVSTTYLQSALQFRLQVTQPTDFTWSGGGATPALTLPANWLVTGTTTAVAPSGAGTDTLRFNASVATTITQDRPTPFRVKDLLLAATAGNHTFNGTAGLELTGRLGLLGAPATGQSRLHSFNVPLTLTGERQITVPANVELTLNRPLSGPVGLLKSGAGKLRLNAVATYANETVIEDGTLEIGTVANAIPSGSRVILGGPSSAGMLMLGTYPNRQDLRLSQLETRGLKGRVVAQVEPTPNIFSTLTLDVPAGTRRYFDGELGQSGYVRRNQLALIKQGGGTFTLAGRSQAVGAVNIQAGRLVISGDWSTALGPLTVASGASLAGPSPLGGAVTMRSGATWVAAPVDSSGRPATRRLLRSVTFEPSSKIRLEGPSCPPPGTYPLLETAQSLSVPNPLPAITTAFSTTGKRLALAVQSTTQPATKRLNLVVTASGRTFQQWLTDNAIATTNGGIAAAFTQHGSRYSFDSPARVTLARETASTDARATVTYRRRANTELQFLVETTSALANPAAWTTDLEAQETAVVPTSDGFETVTVTLSQPWPASGAFFVRVRAQLNAPLSPAALLP